MPSEEDKALIQGCINGDRASQETLYKRFAPKMLVVCWRYMDNREEAEDVMQEGFVNVFGRLDQFKHEGSFEGWIRRIMVNKAIEHYRKKTKLFPILKLENIKEEVVEENEVLANIAQTELLDMIQQLPQSYRVVFNLFAFEGLKHREIAVKLGISEGTSKSNLSDARLILQKKIKERMYREQKRNA